MQVSIFIDRLKELGFKVPHLQHQTMETFQLKLFEHVRSRHHDCFGWTTKPA